MSSRLDVCHESYVTVLSEIWTQLCTRLLFITQPQALRKWPLDRSFGADVTSPRRETNKTGELPNMD